jgi:hypothetical protein
MQGRRRRERLERLLIQLPRFTDTRALASSLLLDPGASLRTHFREQASFRRRHFGSDRQRFLCSRCSSRKKENNGESN